MDENGKDAWAAVAKHVDAKALLIADEHKAYDDLVGLVALHRVNVEKAYKGINHRFSTRYLDWTWRCAGSLLICSARSPPGRRREISAATGGTPLRTSSIKSGCRASRWNNYVEVRHQIVRPLGALECLTRQPLVRRAKHHMMLAF
jgi:hypothetical protein